MRQGRVSSVSPQMSFNGYSLYWPTSALALIARAFVSWQDSFVSSRSLQRIQCHCERGETVIACSTRLLHPVLLYSLLPHFELRRSWLYLLQFWKIRLSIKPTRLYCNLWTLEFSKIDCNKRILPVLPSILTECRALNAELALSPAHKVCCQPTSSFDFHFHCRMLFPSKKYGALPRSIWKKSLPPPHTSCPPILHHQRPTSVNHSRNFSRKPTSKFAQGGRWCSALRQTREVVHVGHLWTVV